LVHDDEKECAALGASFFSCLDGPDKLFEDADRAFLKKVFCPALSDRRHEGELFMPPAATFAYVQQLRDLVKGEDIVRSKRKEQFFSTDFVTEDPGFSFPRTWTPSFPIENGKVEIRGRQSKCQGTLHPRTLSKEKAAALLEHVKKTSHPVFDRCSEEGMRWCIYRLGNIEMRTTQEPECEEVVGVIFSIQDHASKSAARDQNLDEQPVAWEEISKVTEYVERSFGTIAEPSTVRRRYYLVLEAQSGQKIVTERLGDGALSWIENPEALDDRNSLAKVTRSKALNSGVTFQDMKAYQAKLTEGVAPSGKRYAQGAFIHAVVFSGRGRK